MRFAIVLFTALSLALCLPRGVNAGPAPNPAPTIDPQEIPTQVLLIKQEMWAVQMALIFLMAAISDMNKSKPAPPQGDDKEAQAKYQAQLAAWNAAVAHTEEHIAKLRKKLRETEQRIAKLKAALKKATGAQKKAAREAIKGAKKAQAEAQKQLEKADKAVDDCKASKPNAKVGD